MGFGIALKECAEDGYTNMKYGECREYLAGKHLSHDRYKEYLVTKNHEEPLVANAHDHGATTEG